MTSPATDPLVERVAIGLWIAEAARCAPNVARQRTAETWHLVATETQDTYRYSAQAIIPIVRDAERDDVVDFFTKAAGDSNETLYSLHRGHKLDFRQTIQWDQLVETQANMANAVANNKHRSKP